MLAGQERADAVVVRVVALRAGQGKADVAGPVAARRGEAVAARPAARRQGVVSVLAAPLLPVARPALPAQRAPLDPAGA